MVHPNSTGASRIPLDITYLLTILNEQGYNVKLFHMTFHGVDIDKNYVELRAKNLTNRNLLKKIRLTLKRNLMHKKTK
jgi:hypothetical protein